MGGTLDEPFRAIEKLVLHPFQRNAAVRTAVFEHSYLVALAYGKKGLTLVHQALAAGIDQFIQTAQGLR